MAIYHFSAKVISRAAGSSAIAAAAYRAAERLYDERLQRTMDFTNKAGVVHSEIIGPEGSPERWQDRETLWNEVEASERQKNSQLAREIEFAIPREMSQTDGIKLARDFVRGEFVDRGMVADLNVHWDITPDAQPKPHAHVMLTMRDVEPDGFGKKHREWNDRGLLQEWREGWSRHANARLMELGIDASIDHRSLQAQGIDLEPQHKIGPAGMRRERRGEDAERAMDHREIARRNGEQIIAKPSIALGAITHQQSTFTDHDLARFVHRHSDDKEQFDQVLSAIKASPELVRLGVDGRGRERFSTGEMLKTEQQLELSAERLDARGNHKITAAKLDRALAAAVQESGAPRGERGHDALEISVQGAASMSPAAAGGIILGEEQQDALRHITGGRDLSLVVGYAGTGKSAMLGVARQVWEEAGYDVRGAALSGIAAESLEAGSGIGSRTIASLEHGWEQGRDLLSSRDVLVVDEAGMIGSRQMERVLGAAERAGAKVVLVGDAEQMQAIDAGAAFRALTERHGAAEITQIRRQREDWQKEATRELATGRTGEALERYESAGSVHAQDTRALARSALVDGWDARRQSEPGSSQVMLAHTRADVAELNKLARGRMRAAGALEGEDQGLRTERGERSFAPGDRIVFLRNERSLGVNNGTLGTLEAMEGSSLAVRLDGADRRGVQVDLKEYAAIDHGYASTIHKSQGITVDHTHILATEGMDRHAAYVGMSRHRQTLSVHYSAEDFKDRDQLVRTLSRDRAKDTTLDYREFAERRGIEQSTPETRELRPSRPHDMFDGLKLKRGRQGPEAGAFEDLQIAPRAKTPGPPLQREVASFERAVDRYAQAWSNAARMRAEDLPVLEHQRLALTEAGIALDAARPEGRADLLSAVRHHPSVYQAMMTQEGRQRTAQLIRGMDYEATVRGDPSLRADRFIKTWNGLEQEIEKLFRFSDLRARAAVEGQMKELALELKLDPPMETFIRTRSRDLGIGRDSGLQRVMRAETIDMGLIRGLSRGRGMDR